MWGTEINVRGGSGHSDSIISSYKTYSLKQAGEVMNKIRSAEIAAGKPKRKVTPIITYLLEELIHVYFKDYAPKGDILNEIIIEDQR